MTLPVRTAARLYARSAGCFFMVLALFAYVFIAGLAWFGIDATAFLGPWLAVGLLGIVLVVARGLRVLLPVAVVVGVVSAGFWSFLWTMSEGFDWPNFVIPIGLSLGASAIAFRGWLFNRRP